MNLTLRIEYQPAPQRGPEAWFVPGGSAAEWLAELLAWGEALETARLLVVPVSASDLTPRGVLVLGAAPSLAELSPRVLPYGALGERCWVPVNAELDPPLADAELEALLAGECTYVWHPQAGLVACAPGEELSAADLLAPPAPALEAWDLAHPGLALGGRLQSIQPEAQLSIDNLLDAARGDIGSRKLRAADLPRVPGEPSPNPLAAAGRGLQGGLARMVLWFTRRTPATATQRTWVNRLEDWATAKLHGLGRPDTVARERELHRLLGLLEKDPDEGLRFALPFGGDAHRGRAQPANQLGRRDVDFRLDLLGGGRPADPWEVAAELQRQLLTRYRELANREIALGRHRRAAYIFAELMGDLHLAATTLADGGHWREAAVLYEQRLNQPVEAARCLREGGLWAEAIALYHRLGRHEVVGDLHQQIEQPEEAALAWRRAVATHLAADDVLSAARLLETKLANPEEAYDLLVAQWPRAGRPEECLRQAFALLGRNAWHESATALIAELPQHLDSARMLARRFTVLVEALAEQARVYPESAVRSRAADETRLLVADALESSKVDDLERIVLAVARLEPQDRLLPRDAHRFLQQRRRQPIARPAAPAPQRSLTLAWENRLDFDCHLEAATSSPQALWLAITDGAQVVDVQRLEWAGRALALPMGARFRRDAGAGAILLAADPHDLRPAIVHAAGHAPLAEGERRRPAGTQRLLVGSHRGLSERTVAVQYGGQETVYVADRGSDAASLVIDTYVTATLASSSALELSPWVANLDALRAPMPFLARDGVVMAGVGRTLFFLRGNTTTACELPLPIRAVVGSAPHTRTRIAVALERGGVMFWSDKANAERTLFADDLDSPCLALTAAGWLVAVSKDEIQVFSTRSVHLRLHARAPGPKSEPLATLATDRPDQVAIVMFDGRVLVYQVPKP